MAFGTCDCCGRTNVAISRTIAYGIETYACAHCFGYDEDAFDDDAGSSGPDPLASGVGTGTSIEGAVPEISLHREAIAETPHSVEGVAPGGGGVGT
jgi:hypothetical protein